MTAADPILNALAQMEQGLREEIKDSFREFRQEIQLDLDGRFDAMHHRLDRLEQEYEMLKAGMARLESEVGSLGNAVARLEAEVALVRESIGRLEARVEREAADREDLRIQAAEFRRRLDALEGRVEGIEGRLPSE